MRSKEENETGADAPEDMVRARQEEKLRLVGKALDIGLGLLAGFGVDATQGEQSESAKAQT